MTLLGYKYLNEEDAQKARKDCSDYYGIPTSPDDTTQYWVNYQYAILNEPPFWYIIYDESILNILGQPVEFDIVEPTL